MLVVFRSSDINIDILQFDFSALECGTLFFLLACSYCEPSIVYFSHICLQVMENQEAVDLVKKVKDPTSAAKQLAAEAVNRKSKDDISCIVVRFK